MNCRECQSLIFAERDGALDESRRATLQAHLDQCADCRAVREELSVASAAWRARKVAVDPDAEWIAIRRRLRAGEAPKEQFRPWARWVVAPLGAVAVLVLALVFSEVFPGEDPRIAAVPQIELVEVEGVSDSTVVFVDGASGWLVVSAGAPAGANGI